MNQILVRFIAVAAFVILAPLEGGLLDGFDRKITARMQGRRGPSVLQAFYDVRKLFNKELLSVNKKQLFLLVSYLFFTIFSGALFFAGYDLLMVFLCASAAGMFLILAASSTHSPMAGAGTMRELVQMMCTEPAELFAAVGFYLASCIGKYSINNSFMTADLIKADKPAVVYIPGFFIAFVFILIIKFRKSPFDLSTSHHANQEVVKGLTSEFSAGAYGIVSLAEWYEEVLLYGVVGLFFITSNPLSIIGAAAAILVVWFLLILVDNTSARVKWDLMFKMSWGVIFIFAGINLLVLEVILKGGVIF